MLALTVKAGDYITIGPDIVIQVLKAGDMFRVAIEAPRELNIERAKVHEQTGDTPECIQKAREKAAIKGFKRTRTESAKSV